MTLVLVLALEIQPTGRTAVEYAIQVPGSKAILELVMAIAIVGDPAVVDTNPCGVDPAETGRPATVRATAVNLRRTVGSRVTVPRD